MIEITPDGLRKLAEKCPEWLREINGSFQVTRGDRSGLWFEPRRGWLCIENDFLHGLCHEIAEKAGTPIYQDRNGYWFEEDMDGMIVEYHDTIIDAACAVGDVKTDG